MKCPEDTLYRFLLITGGVFIHYIFGLLARNVVRKQTCEYFDWAEVEQIVYAYIATFCVNVYP